ncbi:MAG TPA: hypothetical protein VKS79_03555 [Gemmataceae bacterium]|nr:hypothetical protein [Gemmataceae bacterium]
MKGFHSWSLVLACLTLLISATSAPAQMNSKFRFPINKGVWAAAYSPDGSMIAVKGNVKHNDGPSREVQLFSSEDGKLIATLNHECQVDAIAFTPDGKALIAGTIGNECVLWDIKEKKKFASFQTVSDGASIMSVSPDGKRLAVCGSEEHVEIWDLSTLKRITTLGTLGERLYCLAYSPDGKILTAGGDKGTVWFWDTRNWKKVESKKEHSKSVRSVAFIGQNRTLISIGDDLQMMTWVGRKDDDGFYVNRLRTVGDSPLALAVSNDRRTLAVSCGAGEILFFDTSVLERDIAYLNRARVAYAVYKVENTGIAAICFHPTKNELFTGGFEGRVNVWSGVPMYGK